MNFATRHGQTIEQIIEAWQLQDNALIRAMVDDDTITLLESFYIAAAVCAELSSDRFHFARVINPRAALLSGCSEQLARHVVRGDMRRAVAEIGNTSRADGCCLVAMVCDIVPEAPAAFMSHFEMLNEHPDLIGGDV